MQRPVNYPVGKPLEVMMHFFSFSLFHCRIVSHNQYFQFDYISFFYFILCIGLIDIDLWFGLIKHTNKILFNITHYTLHGTLEYL